MKDDMSQQTSSTTRESVQQAQALPPPAVQAAGVQAAGVQAAGVQAAGVQTEGVQVGGWLNVLKNAVLGAIKGAFGR